MEKKSLTSSSFFLGCALPFFRLHLPILFVWELYFLSLDLHLWFTCAWDVDFLTLGTISPLSREHISFSISLLPSFNFPDKVLLLHHLNYCFVKGRYGKILEGKVRTDFPYLHRAILFSSLSPWLQGNGMAGILSQAMQNKWTSGATLTAAFKHWWDISSLQTFIILFLTLCIINWFCERQSHHQWRNWVSLVVYVT